MIFLFRENTTGSGGQRTLRTLGMDKMERTAVMFPGVVGAIALSHGGRSGYLRAYTWARVVNWPRHKHPRANWKWLRRRYLPGWWPTEGDVTLFDPNAVAITYARYRGQIIDTTPWKPTALT